MNFEDEFGAPEDEISACEDEATEEASVPSPEEIPVEAASSGSQPEDLIDDSSPAPVSETFDAPEELGSDAGVELESVDPPTESIVGDSVINELPTTSLTDLPQAMDVTDEPFVSEPTEPIQDFAGFTEEPSATEAIPTWTAGEELHYDSPAEQGTGDSANSGDSGKPGIFDEMKDALEEKASALASGGGANNKQLFTVAGIAGAVLLVVAVLFGTHVLCIHDWQDATCDAPRTCSICGRTEGEKLEHDWQDATCEDPETCALCGKTRGKANGHNWEEATCTSAERCTRCGKQRGGALGHDLPEFETTKEATCTEAGERRATCRRCGEVVTESIPKVDHKPGDWEVTEAPSVTSSGNVIPGTRQRKCTVCGQVVESESFTIEVTVSQQNALESALSYLSWTAFSYSGLVEQLEFEGYSHEDATFAADYCGADWNEQAAKQAESYLSWTSFSRSGLIHQLEFEGFTREQAEYGCDAVGLTA